MKIPRKLKKAIKNNITNNLPKNEFKNKNLRITYINKKENKVRYIWA